MSTLKICTHDRTQWITNVSEIVLAESFNVEHFDDPIQDSNCPRGVVQGDDVRVTTVVDFQKPNEESKVGGDTIGNVLLITRVGEYNYISRLIVPARSCFLMSDSGETIDRI